MMADKREDDFYRHLVSVFRGEASEHIRTISSGLIELERKPEERREKEIIELIYREAHSLKGASRAVNLTSIEAICQSVEAVLSSLKHGEIAASAQMYDILHKAVDTISAILASSKDEAPDASALLHQIDDLIIKTKPQVKNVQRQGRASQAWTPSEAASEKAPKQAAERAAEVKPQGAPQPAGEKPVMSETVRVSVAKLDSLLLLTEEMLSAKISAGQHVAHIREIRDKLTEWEREWAKVHPGAGYRGRASGAVQERLHEFLEWSSDYVKSLKHRLKDVAEASETSHKVVSGMVDHLIYDMKKTLMFQFSALLDMFPKLVRDLSRAQSKDIEIAVTGGDIEIDRRILEEMKDPLIHMVRNSIDHGIESPEARRQKGKPAQGKITIAVSHADTNKVEIIVSDDGSGINIEKVKASAVEKGVITEKEAREMSEQDAISLIFMSEVSTSPIITDISGRGLGLAILQEKVAKLGGSLTVNAGLHTGASFRILIPLTKATFRGVMARVSDHLFVIPSASVESVARIKEDDVRTIENRETIMLEARAVSLVRLKDILGIQSKEEGQGSDFMHIIVLSSDGKIIGVCVDEILEEIEILVKDLGRQLSRVRNISGATVLGTGRVVPILNPSDLMKSALKAGGAPLAAAMPKQEGKKKKSVLIAEDSITSRMLLKNILETAGYEVKTSVDGVDAFAALRTGEYDLVVSDVEMPRMNGFELTAMIRGNKKLAGIPVILVTGLESSEDREKGIDAGANAYIVKSSFDQSNLLEVIRRLV